MWGFSFILKLKWKHFFKWKGEASTLFSSVRIIFAQLIWCIQIRFVCGTALFTSAIRKSFDHIFCPAPVIIPPWFAGKWATGVRASSWCYGYWKPFRYAKLAQNPTAYNGRTKRTCISLRVSVMHPLSCFQDTQLSSPWRGKAIRGDDTHLRQVLQKKMRNTVWADLRLTVMFASGPYLLHGSLERILMESKNKEERSRQKEQSWQVQGCVARRTGRVVRRRTTTSSSTAWTTATYSYWPNYPSAGYFLAVKGK